MSEQRSSTRENHQRDDDPMIGAVLSSRYVLKSQLGSGGMGAVYLAEDLENAGQSCAVKLLHPGQLDERKLKRFQEEQRLVSQLNNPYIVKIYESGQLWDGRPFLVMEVLTGETLESALQRGHVFNELEVLTIGLQLLQALLEAHKLGIIHRDLKPGNIFWEPGRDLSPLQIKLLDFGIAKDIGLEESLQLTATGMLVGTPRYMAPEQFAREPLSPATDLYALGVLLYLLLSGAPPFVPDDARIPKQLRRMPPSFRVGWLHLHTPPPPLKGEVNPELWKLLKKLLDKEPARRGDGTASVLRRVYSIIEGLSTEEEGRALPRPAADFGREKTLSLPVAAELRERSPARNFLSRLTKPLKGIDFSPPPRSLESPPTIELEGAMEGATDEEDLGELTIIPEEGVSGWRAPTAQERSSPLTPQVSAGALRAGEATHPMSSPPPRQSAPALQAPAGLRELETLSAPPLSKRPESRAATGPYHARQAGQVALRELLSWRRLSRWAVWFFLGSLSFSLLWRFLSR